jgi:acetyltransferase-like isoleucine patch superfamily enzyme
VTILNGGSITIGDRCNFGKYAHLKVNGGRIVLGERVKINRFCIVQAHQSVVIENDVLTAPYVHIMDANHNFETDRSVKEADGKWGLTSQPVVVGADAWLGSRVVVLAGVTIGAHAVIGAGSVVTKDVPPSVVAAGVPCKVLKDRRTTPLRSAVPR